jgi:uncharacterized OB-fold protein
MTYFRAIDPFPLESAEHTKLHEFYTRLATGRLATTKCSGCGRTAWPPRGFCAECAGDRFEWIDLPVEGTVHGFSVQETGLPAGFDAPRVFAVVTVGGHRIFTVVKGADPATLAIGTRVRLAPMQVTDGPKGEPRWLPAFTLA